ncbi:hypothetical protein [Faunimonas pinastri]|uniref:hypothetical protein n=1 Tax=Faunimonas pinastri TaxID=1855383 RepID=UPI00115FF200|nr:hypothetical protein [Faunimonas pinastri]
MRVENAPKLGFAKRKAALGVVLAGMSLALSGCFGQEAFGPTAAQLAPTAPAPDPKLAPDKAAAQVKAVTEMRQRAAASADPNQPYPGAFRTFGPADPRMKSVDTVDAAKKRLDRSAQQQQGKRIGTGEEARLKSDQDELLRLGKQQQQQSAQDLQNLSQQNTDGTPAATQ